MPQLGTTIGIRNSRNGSALDLRIDRPERKPKQRMSARRIFISAASLCLGLLGFYAVLHYVPAYLLPSNMLKDTADQRFHDRRDGRSDLVNLVAPYWDALRIRNTYIWDGERIEVRYALEPGETVELSVTRCARFWVVEILKCDAVEQSRVTIDHTSTSKFIRVSKPGFYEFRETVLTGDRTPRIVWGRSHARR